MLAVLLGDALDDSCSTDGCSSGFLPLTEDEKTIVFLRTRHSVSSLCDAHRKCYIKMYSLNQKKCCDPIERHKDKSITRSLSAITLAMAQQYSTNYVSLVPGKKLCTECRKKVIELQQSSSGDACDEESPRPVEDEWDAVTMSISALLTSISC